MIREKQAKAFCREDISLIENYDLAIADKTKMWDCHHRNGIQFTKAELIANGQYWKRPASELIFLTRSEHVRLHSYGNQKTKGMHWSEEHKRKISESHDKKPVCQIDITTGAVIKKWESIQCAAKTLGIGAPNICACCKGRKNMAKGFKWKYAE